MNLTINVSDVDTSNGFYQIRYVKVTTKRRADMNIDRITCGFRYINLCGESFGIKIFIGIYNGT